MSRRGSEGRSRRVIRRVHTSRHEARPVAIPESRERGEPGNVSVSQEPVFNRRAARPQALGWASSWLRLFGAFVPLAGAFLALASAVERRGYPFGDWLCFSFFPRAPFLSLPTIAL